MSAKLTIAIPTVNRSYLLRRSLESAIAQTSDRIEILVSDNGSTDDTPKVVAQYRDPRLRSVRREVTVPRAQHGALIFAQIETELVVVLSDDDYIAPTFSAEVLALFDEHPELSFAYTGCFEHYDDQAFPGLVGPRVESSLDFLAAYYAGQRNVSWCACVTRIDDLRRFGPQPEDRICGDMFFWTQIAFRGPIGCVARPLSHYTALLPGSDNQSRTTPVIAWAHDVNRLAEEVKGNVRRTDACERYQLELDANMGRYLARSIANQFVWARIFGMSRFACLRIVPAVLKFRGWHIQALTRVFAALVLSRAMLRKLVVRGAARVAKARRA